METRDLLAIAFVVIVLGVVAWRVRGQKYNGPPSVFDAADANTKAIQDNTAAIRELIAKLDQSKS